MLASCGKMVADSSDMERTPWNDVWRWPVICTQGTDDLRLKTWKQAGNEAGTQAEANRGTATSTTRPRF